jgi:hypothetical protein
MSRFWKFALALALLLQTAWSTTVHAMWDEPCYFTLNCQGVGCPIGLGGTEGEQYVSLVFALHCEDTHPGDFSNRCGPNIDVCCTLSKWNSGCTAYSFEESSSIPTNTGIIGCGADWPANSWKEADFYPTTPPASGVGYYDVGIEIYNGNSCGGTAISVTIPHITLKWDGSGWSKPSGCGS